MRVIARIKKGKGASPEVIFEVDGAHGPECEQAPLIRSLSEYFGAGELERHAKHDGCGGERLDLDLDSGPEGA